VHHRSAAVTGAVITLITAAAACGTSPLAAPHAEHPIDTAQTSKAAAPAESIARGVRHVFLIVLENESYHSTFVANPNPYLGNRLQKQGRLLTRYYSVGHHSLDNYIAMISGQAPNTATSADCLTYSNFNRTTANARINRSGQAVGTGCVYPKNVKTLGDQLSKAGVNWHGYMQSMGNNQRREQSRCGVPTVNRLGIDDTQAASAGDQYAARHNPFVYFRSLIDSGLCRKQVRPLTDLPHALKSTSNAPSFSFITPDLCDDGHDSPCAGTDVKGSKTGGLTSVDHFLSVWVPRIKRSRAYRSGGLIIITSDEADTGDASSCCGEKPGPGEGKPGETGPGGGRIGALVVGKCVTPNSTDSKRYNHYSLLRSLENIYGIHTGGADGKGHLGYAGASGLRPFGHDVFNRC
jgi:hypothetical protein